MASRQSTASTGRLSKEANACLHAFLPWVGLGWPNPAGGRVPAPGERRLHSIVLEGNGGGGGGEGERDGDYASDEAKRW